MDAGGVAVPAGQVLGQCSGKLHVVLGHTVPLLQLTPAFLPPTVHKECLSTEEGWPVPQYPAKRQLAGSVGLEAAVAPREGTLPVLFL